MEPMEFYKEEFERFLAQRTFEPAWLQEVRKEAFARFESMGLPGKRTESWKYTSVRPFTSTPFAVQSEAPALPSAELLNDPLVNLANAHKLVFADGYYVAAASSIGELPDGATLSSLAAALKEENAELKEFLQGELEKLNDVPFSALNLAFFTDGLWLSVPRNTVLEQPIHLLFVASDSEQPHLHQLRNLMVSGVSSDATVIESYIGAGDNTYFTNTVSSVTVAKNAYFDHYKLQEEASAGVHIGHVESFVERDAHFSNHNIQIGGQVVRNEVRSTFLDQNAECTLNGLTIAGEGQSIDNRTNIEHAKPHCNSYQVYKTILSGNGKGVFNGKIHVHPDAQKTDAKQNNQALLLSDNCQINSKPELEIYADDVKCTHGATSGYLDDESMFYLRSRGISTEDAKGILTYAFANEVLESFRFEELGKQLEVFLAQRFRQ